MIIQALTFRVNTIYIGKQYLWQVFIIIHFTLNIILRNFDAFIIIIIDISQRRNQHVNTGSNYKNPAGFLYINCTL